MNRGYRLDAQADVDLADILAWSGRRFGIAQRDRYAELIAEALRRITANPSRPGSTDRSDLLPGLRAYPLWLVARRRSASRHIVFYRAEHDFILVVRILHDAMEVERHLSPTNDH